MTLPHSIAKQKSLTTRGLLSVAIASSLLQQTNASDLAANLNVTVLIV